ncbi:MAG: helix-hairpin-helix domain-containing protein [Planctomycetes bacterium]|nr:helix-hairpin-helix domain-containing protein [Planctomycetota bacterium]
MAADRADTEVRSTGLLLAVLALLMVYSLARTATSDRPAPGAATEPVDAATTLRIDPNRAGWWELTVIPGVGEVTAQRIVDHRRAWREDLEPATGDLSSDAAFHVLDDLQRVKGIGPKTAARMAPYLTFAQEPVMSPGSK